MLGMYWPKRKFKELFLGIQLCQIYATPAVIFKLHRGYI